MRRRSTARRLTVLVGEADRHRDRPLAAEIVRRAQQAGLAGCSVFRGIEGFGAGRTVHDAHLLSLSDDLPLAVVVVDEAARVEAFLSQLDGLVVEGLVVLDDVEIVRYERG